MNKTADHWVLHRLAATYSGALSGGLDAVSEQISSRVFTPLVREGMSTTAAMRDALCLLGLSALADATG